MKIAASGTVGQKIIRRRRPVGPADAGVGGKKSRKKLQDSRCCLPEFSLFLKAAIHALHFCLAVLGLRALGSGFWLSKIGGAAGLITSTRRVLIVADGWEMSVRALGEVVAVGKWHRSALLLMVVADGPCSSFGRFREKTYVRSGGGERLRSITLAEWRRQTLKLRSAGFVPGREQHPKPKRPTLGGFAGLTFHRTRWLRSLLALLA